MRTPNPPMPPPSEGALVLLKLPDVMRRTLMSRSAIYRQMDIGTFPRHIKLGVSNRWLAHEIQAWLAARIAERDARSAA